MNLGYMGVSIGNEKIQEFLETSYFRSTVEMRLALVSPLPFIRDVSPQAINTLEKGADRFLLAPPLGLLYLATFLQNDYDVAVFDNQLHMGLSAEDIAQKIYTLRPDVIGIGVNFLPVMSRAKLIARKIKQIDAEVTIVFGGNATTFTAYQLIKEDYIDIVVLREGEINFSLCLDRISKVKPLSDVPGIVYKENDHVRRNDFSGYIENLDTLPFPSYNFLEKPDRYVKHIISSRGCPFECFYCSTRSMWKKWRARSAQNVVHEMTSLIDESRPELIGFADDNFVVDRKRVVEIAELLKGNRTGIRWGFAARIDMVDEELLKIVGEANCKRIFFGIESGSEAVLARLNRLYSVTKVEHKINKCIEYGILPTASFMLGMPWETIEDVKATFNLMQRLKTSNILLQVFTPLVGTEVFDYADRYDVKIERDVSEEELFPFGSLVSHSTKYLSSDEIKRLWIEGQDIVLARYSESEDYRRQIDGPNVSNIQYP
ncbi:B12-binding domain-containing radical SAM protein [bacterium]|nr:B12-binding domain-containing radical SAM protein [bacterium]